MRCAMPDIGTSSFDARAANWMSVPTVVAIGFESVSSEEAKRSPYGVFDVLEDCFLPREKSKISLDASNE